MELYSRNISPFASRVRVSILAKSLSIRVVEEPDVSSELFGRLNPYRRVPVLVLDDGTAIPESETIVEYLEEAFPSIPLLPVDATARARVRLIARIAELYVFPAVVPLFEALALRDEERVERLFVSLDRILCAAEPFLQDSNSWHAWGNQLTLADGALAPFLFYVHLIGQSCGRAPLSRHARLQRFWEGAQEHPVLAQVTAEIAAAFAAKRSAKH